MTTVSEFSLPKGFLTGLRESYKYFFFKALIELCPGHNAPNQDEVISYMVVYAWPIVIKESISLGETDQLVELCQELYRRTGDQECPSIASVLTLLRSGRYNTQIGDISRVFFRFAEAWIGRRFSKDYLPEELSERYGVPYYILPLNGKTRIVFQPYWKQYCTDNHEYCNALYVEQITTFLEKRNRYSKRVKDGLRRALDCNYSTQETSSLPLPAPVDDNNSRLARIPYSFLFRSPYIVPRVGVFNMPALRAPKGVNNLADLLNASVYRRKHLQEVQMYVERERQRIETAFEYYQELPIIPQEVNYGDSIGTMFSAFVQEYVDRISLRNSFLEPRERARMNAKLNVFTYMYDDRIVTDGLRNSLASEMGIHPERVRQIQYGMNDTIGLKYLIDLLNGTVQSEDFILNPLFQSLYMEFSNNCELAERRDSFDKKCGYIGIKTKSLLLDTLDLHQADNLRYLEPFIIKGEYVTFLNRNIGSIMKYFNDEVTYVSIEDSFLSFLKSKTTLDYNDPALAVAIDVVKHSELFESENNQGKDYYRLKWQYLQSVPSRLARILYEMGGVVHYSKLYEEYNRRAELFNLPPEIIDEKFSTRSHPFIRMQGKTGNWFFQKNTDDKSSSSDSSGTLLNVIKNFIIDSGGLVKKQDVVEHLASIGYNANPKSIHTYLNYLCKVPVSQSGVFVYKEWLDRFPELEFNESKLNDYTVVLPIVLWTLALNRGKARMADLIKSYSNETGNSIRDTSLQEMLNRIPELVSIQYEGKRKYLVLQIPEEDALELDSDYFKSDMPDYQKQIRDAILELLNSAPYKCLKLSDVVKSVSPLLPAEKHRNIIYKIVDKASQIEVYYVEGKRFLRLAGGS